MWLALALEEMEAARQYTKELLAGLAPDDWFRMPAPAVSHIAWQVGHLTVSQRRLCRAFLREAPPEDIQFFEKYRPLFGRDSVPQADPGLYPAPAELRAMFDEVHAAAIAELRDFPEADLDSPVLARHRFLKTKRQALFWVSRHEMLHAGQIGLLRRLLGLRPQW